MENPSPTPPTPSARAPLSERMKAFVAEYGFLAVVVHSVLFGLFLAGFAVAIRYFGFRPQSAASEAGVWGMAYVAAQLIKIPRFALTFAVTPLVARVMRRLRRNP